jgi:hypothetical protein
MEYNARESLGERITAADTQDGLIDIGQDMDLISIGIASIVDL